MGIFWDSVEILGVLRVLVSYEVTRGVILVVERVTDGFWGGSRGSWGGLGGLFYPYWARFVAL